MYTQKTIVLEDRIFICKKSSKVYVCTTQSVGLISQENHFYVNEVPHLIS